MVVIFAIGPINLPAHEQIAGYVSFYDPDSGIGGESGDMTTTADPKKALQFATIIEAYEFARQVSKRSPVRPDGKPNRPLTAFTLEFITLPEQPK